MNQPSTAWLKIMTESFNEEDNAGAKTYALMAIAQGLYELNHNLRTQTMEIHEIFEILAETVPEKENE